MLLRSRAREICTYSRGKILEYCGFSSSLFPKGSSRHRFLSFSVFCLTLSLEPCVIGEVLVRDAVHPHSSFHLTIQLLFQFFSSMSLGLGHEVSGLFGAASSTITGQVRTNLGPLTTTFTQPPSCTIAIAEQEDNILTGFLAYTCALSQRNSTGLDNTSCWPGTSSGAAAPSVPFQGWGFYSPGTICPTGYSSACSATGGASSSSGWPVQFQLLEGETAVGCCPRYVD